MLQAHIKGHSLIMKVGHFIVFVCYRRNLGISPPPPPLPPPLWLRGKLSKDTDGKAGWWEEPSHRRALLRLNGARQGWRVKRSVSGRRPTGRSVATSGTRLGGRISRGSNGDLPLPQENKTARHLWIGVRFLFHQI